MKFHFHSGKSLEGFLLKFWDLSGAKECKSCRSRKMLQNEPLVAIVTVDTAENEPLKVWGDFIHFSFVSLIVGSLPYVLSYLRLRISEEHPRCSCGARRAQVPLSWSGASRGTTSRRARSRWDWHVKFCGALKQGRKSLQSSVQWSHLGFRPIVSIVCLVSLLEGTVFLHRSPRLERAIRWAIGFFHFSLRFFFAHCFYIKLSWLANENRLCLTSSCILFVQVFPRLRISVISKKALVQ